MVLCAADGRTIADREELMRSWEGLFVAEFSGHANAVAFEEARQEVAELFTKFSLATVDRSEREWVAALVDALVACESGLAVGPDTTPVEFSRSSGVVYMRLLAQV